MIKECFEDTILQILILAAVVAIIIGTWQHPDYGWIEGTSIFFAILIIVSVTAGNDWVKERQF
jgi:Ca2+ transporting ATPase